MGQGQSLEEDSRWTSELFRAEILDMEQVGCEGKNRRCRPAPLLGTSPVAEGDCDCTREMHLRYRRTQV